MKKLYSALLFSLLLSLASQAQQDAMFTKYMFNSLMFNPAYAGSYGHMSLRLLHRTQWWDIEGAPTTQSFSVHTPLGDRVGVGLNLANDAIGPTKSITANASYAYRISLKKGTLALGLQAGAMNWRANWADLNVRDPSDQAYGDNMAPNFWMPNFGAGIYFSTKTYYLGFSVPHLVNYDLRQDVENEEVAKWAKFYRHYFFAAGAAFRISPEMVFKPSVLIKNVGLFGDFNPNQTTLNRTAAPTALDIDVSVMFYDALWVGAAYRTAFEQFNNTSSHDSADLWAAYYLRNGMRIGLAYDFTVSQLASQSGGSFEVMLGYDMDYTIKQMATPRYF